MAEFPTRKNNNSCHAAIESSDCGERPGINDGLVSTRGCSSAIEHLRNGAQKQTTDDHFSTCICHHDGHCNPQNDCTRSIAKDELLRKGLSQKKLCTKAGGFAVPCDGFDYQRSSGWISDDRGLDEWTGADCYCDRRRKLSPSYRKDSNLNCHDCSDDDRGMNISINSSDTSLTERGRRYTCLNDGKNAEDARDPSLLQVGNEQPHLLRTSGSPLYEHSIPRDGSDKKVWQASQKLMANKSYGAPKHEIIILDSSDEESAMGDEANACLQGLRTESKQYDGEKENTEKKIEKGQKVTFKDYSDKFETCFEGGDADCVNDNLQDGIKADVTMHPGKNKTFDMGSEINVSLQGPMTESMQYDGKEENTECRIDKDQNIKLKDYNNKLETNFEGDGSDCVNDNLHDEIRANFTTHPQRNKTIDIGLRISKNVTEGLPGTATAPQTIMSSIEALLDADRWRLQAMGIEPRLKKMIDKYKLPIVTVEEKAMKDPPVIVPKANLFNVFATEPHLWDTGVQCDLCHKGPSLLMGEWYSWCCGLRLSHCTCSPALKLRLKSTISLKKASKPKLDDGISWSGVVHKMCGLWSSEVYEEGERLQDLLKAVKRGRSLKCNSCRGHGATLGCRVKSCRRSFHYPCADELASKLCCRMWDGVQLPIACHGHRHVLDSCMTAKEKVPGLKRRVIKDFVPWGKIDMLPKELHLGSSYEKESTLDGYASFHCQSIKNKNEVFKSCNIMTETSSESEDLCQNSAFPVDGMSNQRRAPVRCLTAIAVGYPLCLGQAELDSRCQLLKRALYYMGENVLSKDISSGCETVPIPCTNDIDSDPAPSIRYITENRYCGEAKQMLQTLLLEESNLACICEGCQFNEIDNPQRAPFIHATLKLSQRVSSPRFDWQGQPMMGRLSYDQYGRLLLGSETREIVECNSRCPCQGSCLNKELQKGMRIPLEVFKTNDRGWGVRTMEQIPRGKFVVEYVGEVLSRGDADKRGLKFNQSNMSVECYEDCRNVSMEDSLVVDHSHMSNVSRFINHSCDGNLRMYRIYTEITAFRFFRMGLYAVRDIEFGEELCYDYADRICKTSLINDRLKCVCGATSCRGSV